MRRKKYEDLTLLPCVIADAVCGREYKGEEWSAALRSQVTTPGGAGGLRQYRLFEKEFSVVKHWHDFYTRLSARFRPGNVKDVSVRVDVKFGSFDADRQTVHDWESEWFPERTKGREDRP